MSQDERKGPGAMRGKEIPATTVAMWKAVADRAHRKGASAMLREIIESPASQAALRSVLDDPTNRHHKAMTKLVKKHPDILLPLPDAQAAAPSYVVEVRVEYEAEDAPAEAPTPEPPAPDEFRAQMRRMAERGARTLAKVLNDPTHPNRDAIEARARREAPELLAAAKRLANGPDTAEHKAPTPNPAPDLGKSTRRRGESTGKNTVRATTRPRKA